jgi:hypothetical protein
VPAGLWNLRKREASPVYHNLPLCARGDLGEYTHREIIDLVALLEAEQVDVALDE